MVNNTKEEMRAKMLGYLERAKNLRRRGKSVPVTVYVHAADGVTAWDFDIENDEQQRMKLENLVFGLRPDFLSVVADTWVVLGDPDPEYCSAAEHPERVDALIICSTHRQHGMMTAMQVYGADERGRGHFTEPPRWCEGPNQSDGALNLFTDIWAVLPKGEPAVP